MTYDLIDGVERNLQSPSTFNLPSQEEKGTLGPGDFVKFGFVLPRPIGSYTVERLWVEITAVVNGVITGTLANEPVHLEARHGDVVRGELRHVLDVHQAKKRTLQ